MITIKRSDINFHFTEIQIRYLMHRTLNKISCVRKLKRAKNKNIIVQLI